MFIDLFWFSLKWRSWFREFCSQNMHMLRAHHLSVAQQLINATTFVTDEHTITEAFPKGSQFFDRRPVDYSSHKWFRLLSSARRCIIRISNGTAAVLLWHMAFLWSTTSWMALLQYECGIFSTKMQNISYNVHTTFVFGQYVSSRIVDGKFGLIDTILLRIV